jgi:hypothetical protein
VLSAPPPLSSDKETDMDTETNAAAAVLPPKRGISLAALKAKDTAEYEIKWPGEEPREGTGWIIEFAGPGHPKTVAWNNEAQRKTLRRQERIEAQQLNGKKVKPEERDVEEQRRENARWIAARIVAWRGLLGEDGQPLPFAEETAVRIFLDPDYAWAYHDAIDFLVGAESFIKRSAVNS